MKNIFPAADGTARLRLMRCVPYGPDAFLIEFADAVGDEAFVRARALVESLEQSPLTGLVEFVPAFTSLLLEFQSGTTPPADALLAELNRRMQSPPTSRLNEPEIKEVPVRYDGPDLDRVAKSSGLSVPEVCQLHAERLYKVYMLGFSPGFPYLGDLNPRLHTPRLEAPRPRVAAGSVAIGGEHTGIYPVESPGGWNIIGHTTVRLFDPVRGSSGDEAAMFFLRMGDRVRFVPLA